MKKSSWASSFSLAISALLAATAYAACTDSYSDPEASGPGSGPGGPGGGGDGGSGGVIIDTDSGVGCDDTCSNDLTAVVDCYGQVKVQCTSDQGCANAKCIDNPCQAAEESKSSYGCDYWALKTALRPQADGACFAAFVANTWSKPVHLEVSRKGSTLDPSTFAYIPSIGANGAIQYDPYNAATGIDVGQVAILFLSRKSQGASVVDCPKPAALNLETGVIDTGKGDAFHITTDYPVVAYQISPYGGGQAYVTSATLLLPTSAWDTNYLAINAYKASEIFSDAWPSMAILAHQDNTKVTLLPNVAVVGGGGVPASEVNKPVDYILNAGQFLQITQPEELTGSPIASDKPIGVFGASKCMNVPSMQDDCDSGQQQLAPVRALGNEYVAVRYKSRSSGSEESSRWRLVGAVDGTALTWTPTKPAGAPTTINQGQVLEFDDPGPFVVRSQDVQHPFYLGAYMTGGAPFAAVGDPDWVNVVPPQQFLRRYVLFTDPTYPETSLVVVRVKSKVTGEFAPVTLKCKGELDGWQAIGDYEYTRVDLVKGDFQGVDGCTNGPQEMSSTQPFGATVWGWGTTQQTLRVSYAYPAGAGFLPINEIVVPPTPK
ncbi:IgGFc-binding protein [Polyangium jinanense]|uniref:IgGFc-binding protein n=1 Tax=Polyangium jinanense TaxID=2829994 RepID=A0A9X3XAI1_9BACT|nr:IgGFc-binding protein [Polyangium jinanense]MDC3956552.1 IgGFc-binding protein [Polyangium jinanense]MDC3985665.1 IgGFc-binding protein [Polyangium jinanense]